MCVDAMDTHVALASKLLCGFWVYLMGCLGGQVLFQIEQLCVCVFMGRLLCVVGVCRDVGVGLKVMRLPVTFGFVEFMEYLECVFG